MADLSNKALALLLLVAIVVSTSGTIITLTKMDQTGSITGRVVENDTATTDITIASNLSIVFVQDAIHFGSGTPNAGACAMGTNNSGPATDAECLGFNATVADANLTLENNGNILANVSLNFSANASTFIGGTSPSLQYEVTNGEASSCTTIMNGSSFQVVDAIDEQTPAGARVCRTLDFQEASDLLEIGLWILVPQDAPVNGGNTVTILAIGCDDSSC